MEFSLSVRLRRCPPRNWDFQRGPTSIWPSREFVPLPISVEGCWDEGIGHKRADCGCKFITEEDATHGDAAFVWTHRRVRREHRLFLRDLPFGCREAATAAGDLLYVHGSPKSTSEYLAESTHDVVLLERAATGGCDVLFCGHTHVPFARRIDGVLRVRAEAGVKDGIQRALAGKSAARPGEIQLRPKLIINAGSVGEPRHGGTEATYVIFNTGTQAVEIRRVSYPVAETARAMRKRGLPDAFTERLLAGRELAGKHKKITCAC